MLQSDSLITYESWMLLDPYNYDDVIKYWAQNIKVWFAPTITSNNSKLFSEYFLKRTISEKGNNYKIYPLPVNNFYTSKMLYSWKSVRTSSLLSKNKSRKRDREKQQIKTKTNKRSVHTHTWRSRESKPEDHIERIWSINMIKNVSVKNVKM